MRAVNIFKLVKSGVRDVKVLKSCRALPSSDVVRRPALWALFPGHCSHPAPLSLGSALPEPPCALTALLSFHLHSHRAHWQAGTFKTLHLVLTVLRIKPRIHNRTEQVSVAWPLPTLRLPPAALPWFFLPQGCGSGPTAWNVLSGTLFPTLASQPCLHPFPEDLLELPGCQCLWVYNLPFLLSSTCQNGSWAIACESVCSCLLG